MSRPEMPTTLDSMRSCPYCSYSTSKADQYCEHIKNHTEDEKNYLQSGDITRLIALLQKEQVDKESYLRMNKCCNYKDCLHNYRDSHDVRIQSMIDKLGNYVDENSVATVTAKPTGFKK